MSDERADITRRDDVLERNFSPESLVRSWFHKLDEDQFVWQGLVVAEPQPGCYLCEIHDWFTGDPLDQKLVHIDAMLNRTDDVEWRFYDSREKMRTAYFRAEASKRVEEDVEERA